MFKTENLALMFWQSYFKKILNIFSSLKSALIIFWMDYWHKTIKDTKQCQKGNNRQNTIAATFNHNLSLIVLFAITEQTMKTARIRGEIIVTLRPDNATTPLLTGNLLKKKKSCFWRQKQLKRLTKKQICTVMSWKLLYMWFLKSGKNEFLLWSSSLSWLYNRYNQATVSN